MLLLFDNFDDDFEWFLGDLYIFLRFKLWIFPQLFSQLKLMLCLQFLLWLSSVDFLSNLRIHQLHLSAKAHLVFTLLFHVLQLFNYQYLCLNHLFKVFWHHSELEVSMWLYIYHHSYWWDIHSIGVHIHAQSSQLYSQTQ